MKIIVDADSQPAKDRVIETAKRHKIKLVFVHSTAHFSPGEEEGYPEVVMVDNEKQAADIAVMNMARPGDITLTNDTGLASVLTGKGVFVLAPAGSVIDEKNIDARLAEAHRVKKALRSGPMRRGKKPRGPSKYTKQDGERLINALEEIILKANGENN